MLKKFLIIVGLGLALQGCALTDAELDVGPDMEAINQGPISDATPLVFKVNDFEDARDDRERVGYKKNGFGQNMGDIDADEPVPVIVADAISAAAVANGHTIGEGGVAIDGVVNRFWIETDINFTNIEIACDIEADITFTDVATSREIYSSPYAGSYSDKKQMGTEKNFKEIIDGALGALIDEIVFDEDLAEALDSI
jgi:uncharacterized lipoprotein YajG